MLFETFQALAHPVSEHEVQVDWSYQSKPVNPSRPYFVCLGRFEHDPNSSMQIVEETRTPGNPYGVEGDRSLALGVS